MSKPGDFDAVRKDIVALLHQPEYDDGSAGPVLVRLAWYDFPINLGRLYGLQGACTASLSHLPSLGRFVVCLEYFIASA